MALKTRRAYTKRIQQIRRHGANQPGTNPRLQQRVARLRQQRRTKFGIPKVNQNPQPAGAPQSPAFTGQVNVTTGPHAPPAPAAPSVNAPVQQDTTSALTTALSSGQPLNPANLFQFSSFQGGEDPRDATYWANLSKLMFNAQTDYASNLSEEANAGVDYTRAIENLGIGRGREQRGLAEEAMRGNLSSSGWLDRSDAEDTTDYLSTVETTNLEKSRGDAARLAARNAILQGYSIDEAAMLAEAAADYADRKAAMAEEGLPDYYDDGGGDVGGGGGGRRPKKKPKKKPKHKPKPKGKRR